MYNYAIFFGHFGEMKNVFWFFDFVNNRLVSVVELFQKYKQGICEKIIPFSKIFLTKSPKFVQKNHHSNHHKYPNPYTKSWTQIGVQILHFWS